MSKDLRLNLILGHLETLTAPLKKIQGGSTKAADALRKQRQQLKQLQAQQRDISSFKKLQAETAKNSKKLDEARARANALAKQLKATDKPSKTLSTRFKQATSNAAKLKAKLGQNREKLHSLNSELKKGGINTKYLDRSQAKLKRQMDKTNMAMQQQKQKLEQINTRQKQMAKLSAAGANVRGQFGRLMGQGAIAGAAGGYFFKTQFLDTAAMFEDYQAVLRAVEGSNAKAKKSMEWISDFAATTPYELGEVTEAYKQLRAYGLDPTTGLLKDLGDASSAMNKPLLQSIEAIADAVTGENERLKEFGIRASTAGDQVTYEYTNRAGEQRTATVDKNNRKEIESTLRTIWNQKYANAMRERSKTWRGMLSNIGDQWSRFALMVMEQGLFDWMKDKLGGLLDKINEMAADGSLQAYAKDVGEKLIKFATGLWAAGSAISSAISNIADLVGGWENLIYILAALKLAPLISSLWSMGKAMFALSGIQLPMVLGAFKALAAFLVTPAGWLVLAIAGAIAVAGALIYTNWETVGPFFKNLWNEIQQAFEGGIIGITKLLLSWSPMGLIVRAYKGLWDMGNEFMGEQEAKIDNSGRRVNRYKRHEPIRMAAAGGSNSTTTIEAIHVHPSQGMDEQQLAAMVGQEVKRAQTRRDVANRSRLRDDD
jgi:cation transport regulator ChaC